MVEDTEDHSEVYEAINDLSPETQHIVKLRFYEDMPLNEVAHIMNMNISTVKSKLYRGLKTLKKKMEDVPV